jgi:hypothetical protein
LEIPEKLKLLDIAFGADTVTERRLRVFGYVLLQLVPAVVVVPDLFALHADRDDPLQLFHPVQAFLQLLDTGKEGLLQGVHAKSH